MSERNKKGQLQMGVTMMVVIVFIVLLLLSMILYFRFTFTEIEETKESLLDQRYSGLLSTLIALPELKCSRAGIESECLDAAKVSIVEEVIRDNEDYYERIFGNVEGIWIDILNTEGTDEYYDEDLFLIYGEKEGNGVIYAVPVSLFYPDYREYKIGILRIRGEL